MHAFQLCVAVIALQVGAVHQLRQPECLQHQPSSTRSPLESSSDCSVFVTSSVFVGVEMHT
jgi:hypothetical protein